jgi:hypothetical protein
LLILPAWSAQAGRKPTPAPVDPNDGKPLTVKVATELSGRDFSSLLLGDLDRPVGEAIVIGGLSVPARVNAKGALELDVKHDGKFARVLTKAETVQLHLEKPGPKPGHSLKLQVTLALKLNEQRVWTYRNLTRLEVRIGDDTVELVDANGNGIWNEPGIDGICWAGQDWIWPLPIANDHWCTPNLEIDTFALGPWGEKAMVTGRPLATVVAETLPLLKRINEERSLVGLPARPEDPQLSAPLQKHCSYLRGLGRITQTEEAGTPGYSVEGHEAGKSSVLFRGTEPGPLVASLVATLYERQDVLRPAIRGFGLGGDGDIWGVDGRRNLGNWQLRQPLLSPAAGQGEVPTCLSHIGIDPIAGDAEAGFPVIVYFPEGSPNLREVRLRVAGQEQEVPCYLFDALQGGRLDLNRTQHLVALIAKDPLAASTTYEAFFETELNGKVWSQTWTFTTAGPAPPAPKK